jgi:hypothetical protein
MRVDVSTLHEPLYGTATAKEILVRKPMCRVCKILNMYRF